MQTFVHLNQDIRWSMRILLFAIVMFLGTTTTQGDPCGNLDVRLECLTVEKKITKIGFPPLLTNYSDPKIFFRKKTENKISSDQSCYVCHEAGSYEASEEWVYNRDTGEGPTNVDWAGLIKYTSTVNGETTSCESKRIGLSEWDNPSCNLPEIAPPGSVPYTTQVSSNRTASAYELTITHSYSGPISYGSGGSSTANISISEMSKINLSEPYSMADFLSEATLDSGWPDWTNGTSKGVVFKGGIKVLDIESDNRATFSADISKVKYRIAYLGPKNEKGTLEWVEIFTPLGGGPVQETTFEQEVKFTGEEQFLYPTGKELGPPTGNGTLEVKLITQSGSLCGADSCGPPGRGSVTNACVSVKIGLGPGYDGKPAGYLYIHELSPSAGLHTPAKLKVFSQPSLEVIKINGNLRQVRAPHALADIVTIANGYEVRFYPGVGQRNPSDNTYATSGSSFATWKFETVPNVATLRVTDSKSQVYNYLYENGVNGAGWTLSYAGLRKDSKLSQTAGADRTETYLLQEIDNRIVYQQVDVWRTFTGIGELLKQTEIGTGTSKETTVWEYYDDPVADGDYYGKVKSVTEPTGYWQKYYYNADGREVKVVSQFQNNGVGTAESVNRVVEYSYTPVHSSDNGTRWPDHPRRTITKLKDKEIARDYKLFRVGETLEIHCTTPSATWNDLGNLFTTNTHFAIGEYNGRFEATTRPDLTLEVRSTSLERNFWAVTNIVSNGRPDSGWKKVIDGTRTESIVDEYGRPVSRRSFDIVSGNVTGSEAYQVDGYHRVIGTTYLDGTSTYRDYGCCSLNSTTDRDGTVTSYTYDALGRVKNIIRNEITTENIYDAAHNVITVIKHGLGGGKITESKTEYNTAGRSIKSTNSMNQITLYSENSTHTEKTTTLPNTGTRIETYFQDGTLEKVTGTAAHPIGYDYDVQTIGTVNYTVERQTFLDANGATGEWVETYTDMVGRHFRTKYSDGNYSESGYNSLGQLVREIEPGNEVTKLYTYNLKGTVERVVTDMDQDGMIDIGSDRITRTWSEVGERGAFAVHRTFTAMQGDGPEVLMSTSEQSVDGLRSWQTRFGLTTSRQTEHLAGSIRITEIAPDGSTNITEKVDGRVVSVVRRDAGGAQLSRVSYGYDEFGRQQYALDDRTGATTITYNNAGQPVTITTPPAVPGPGEVRQKTENFYDNMGQVWRVLLPDGTSKTNKYHLTGELAHTSGSRTYPVGYKYDPQGRLLVMTNWSNFSDETGVRLTTWSYDSQRGWLMQKRDAANKGVDYTYKASGRLETKKWYRVNGSAQRITATYSYNNAGEMSGVSYNDGVTPTLTFQHDGFGRVEEVTQGGITTEYAYNNAGQILTETFVAGPLAGIVVTNKYDGLLRRTNNSTVGITNSFFYDKASRLSVVSNGLQKAEYTYLANSPFVQDVVFKHNNRAVMATTRTFDNLNRLTSIGSQSAGITLPKHNYFYNDANQRQEAWYEDGSSWYYLYDDLGQVTSAKKYWSDGAVAGQHFEYEFDDIGNRLSTEAGGDDQGANLRGATYVKNDLNQYTSRTVPGAVDVIGSSSYPNVTVDGATAYRHGDYFQKTVTFDNSSQAVYETIDVTVPGSTEAVDGEVLLPPGTQAFTYDDDGNLTHDALWNYTWDAENRLIKMESSSVPTDAKKKLEFTYDFRGRRIAKKVSTWDAGTSTYVQQSLRKYIYDGWNLIAELDSANSVVAAYSWGVDLSESLRGAGGVGGLLVASFGANNAHFAAYDGHGNVTAFVNAGTGVVSAQYEYGPFGEPIRVTGAVGKNNPFRFSTKYTDDETDLVYYGFRYFAATTGMWLGRDPISEQGGLNLYGFVRNNPINRIDVLGQNLYAIDGTGNDQSAGSNIPKFSGRYLDGRRYYWGGPGNPTDGVPVLGLTSGAGSEAIVKSVVEQICEDFSKNPAMAIDVVGFSRGAAIANEVAWKLQNDGCPCKLEKRIFFGLIGSRTVRPKVRFLGLFDTVYSYPWPWTPTLHDDELSPNVMNAAHAYARHETRKMFRPSVLNPTGPTDLTERWFDGRHSDVGGHNTMNQRLASISLRWMVEQASASGVKMDRKGLISDDEIRYLQDIGALNPGPANTDPTAWFND
jgi:RHS repeat-associated protein